MVFSVILEKWNPKGAIESIRLESIAFKRGILITIHTLSYEYYVNRTTLSHTCRMMELIVVTNLFL